MENGEDDISVVRNVEELEGGEEVLVGERVTVETETLGLGGKTEDGAVETVTLDAPEGTTKVGAPEVEGEETVGAVRVGAPEGTTKVGAPEVEGKETVKGEEGSVDFGRELIVTREGRVEEETIGFGGEGRVEPFEERELGYTDGKVLEVMLERVGTVDDFGEG